MENIKHLNIDDQALNRRVSEAAKNILASQGTLDFEMLSMELGSLMESDECQSLCWDLAIRFAVERTSTASFDASSVFSLPQRLATNDDATRGRYELRRRLGQGSQGVVFEAIDHAFNDDVESPYVAIKLLREDQNTTEGAFARRLKHSGIARVYDAGTASSGESYVVYDLISGVQLDTQVERYRSSMTESDYLSIVLQICDACKHAHANGVVHRDLKPSNILIDRDGNAVVTDFGIAHSTRSSQSRPGYGTRGSFAFMAPEQFTGGASSRSVSVDVYSIAGILLWLMTGVYPNGNTRTEAAEWLRDASSPGPRVPIAAIQSRRLQAILANALTHSPSDRYQTVDELAEAIQRYRRYEPVKGIDRSAISRMSLFIRRERPIVAASVAAAVVFLAMMCALWSSNQSALRSKYETEIVQQASQLEVSNARVQVVKDKARLVQNVISSWSEASARDFVPETATANMLFVHTLMSDGEIVEDPEFLDGVLNNQVEIAEKYLQHLIETDSSPILIGLWHEIAAHWYQGDPTERDDHLRQAIAIAREFAPNDQAWIDRLVAKRSIPVGKEQRLSLRN